MPSACPGIPLCSPRDSGQECTILDSGTLCHPLPGAKTMQGYPVFQGTPDIGQSILDMANQRSSCQSHRSCSSIRFSDSSLLRLEPVQLPAMYPNRGPIIQPGFGRVFRAGDVGGHCPCIDSMRGECLLVLLAGFLQAKPVPEFFGLVPCAKREIKPKFPDRGIEPSFPHLQRGEVTIPLTTVLFRDCGNIFHNHVGDW